MTIRYLLFSILFISALNLTAQTTFQLPTEWRYIDVVGSSEMEIRPNIIVLSIRLKEYEENKVKVPLDRIENGFMASVSKSNISKEQIQISDLSLTSVQRGRKDRNVFAEKTYEITFSKTEDVLNFLENAKDIVIDNLNILKLSHTDIHTYRLNVKVDALKAAESKAAALLNAVDSKLGKVLSINENTENSWSPQNVASNTMYYQDSFKEASADQMLIKTIKIRYEIQVRFQIN